MQTFGDLRLPYGTTLLWAAIFIAWPSGAFAQGSVSHGCPIDPSTHQCASSSGGGNGSGGGPSIFQPPPPSPAELQRRAAVALNAAGNQAMLRKDWAIAIADYQQALKQYPNSAFDQMPGVIANNLASALSNQATDAYTRGDYDAALAEYQQALQAEPRHSNPLLPSSHNVIQGNIFAAQAEIARIRGDYTAALADCQLAVRANHDKKFKRNVEDLERRVNAAQAQAQQAQAQQAQAKQKMAMRDFQQTLDGKTDLHRLDSTPVAAPSFDSQNLDASSGNKGNGSSSAPPATGASDSTNAATRNGVAVPPANAQSPPAAVTPAMSGNARGAQSVSAPAAGAPPGGAAATGATTPGGGTESQTAGQSAQGVSTPPAGLPAQQLAAPQPTKPTVEFDQQSSDKGVGGPAVQGLKFAPSNGGASTQTVPGAASDPASAGTRSGKPANANLAPRGADPAPPMTQGVQQPAPQPNVPNLNAPAPAAPPPPPAGPLTRIGGTGTIQGAVFSVMPDGREVPLESGRPVYLNEHIRTRPDGHAQFLLLDQTAFTVGPGSDIMLDEVVYDPDMSLRKVSVRLLKGVFRWVSGSLHSSQAQILVHIRDLVNVGIRGTDFDTYVADDGSGYVRLYAGQLEISETKTNFTFLLNSGQMVAFTSDGACSRPMPLLQP